MKHVVFSILRIVLVAVAIFQPVPRGWSSDWSVALPGWEYSFPRDHGPHRDFKTEWWYFTGNLRTEEVGRFGFQLVFFRQGILPPGGQIPVSSRFVTSELALAHFAVTDLEGGGFHYGQKVSRGAFGEAGFGAGSRLAWIDDWECRFMEGRFFLRASLEDGTSLDLALTPAKEPVIHGRAGVSQKSEGEGRASHYVSFTRLDVEGTLAVGGRTRTVEGLAWFDQEWATNQLDAHQTGWDWFSLQFDEGSEMMIFQIRTGDGGMDPFSHGTWIAPDGNTTHIAADDFDLVPESIWKSPRTGAEYPLAWRIRVRPIGLDLRVTTPVRHQELVLDPITYWEGAMSVHGSRNGTPLRGHGYLEMTGYASEVVGMTAIRQ